MIVAECPQAFRLGEMVWLHAVEGKLRDAANADNTEGTRMNAAYVVILYSGLAMLCAEGWRAVAASSDTTRRSSRRWAP